MWYQIQSFFIYLNINLINKVSKILKRGIFVIKINLYYLNNSIIKISNITFDIYILKLFHIFFNIYKYNLN